MSLKEVLEQIKSTKLFSDVVLEDDKIRLESNLTYPDGTVIEVYVYEKDKKIIISDLGGLLDNIHLTNFTGFEDNASKHVQEYLDYYLYGYINLENNILYQELDDDLYLEYHVCRFVQTLSNISYSFDMISKQYQTKI